MYYNNIPEMNTNVFQFLSRILFTFLAVKYTI